MARRASAGQRCPQCGRSFRVLEDEQGMHECPFCGYFPEPRTKDDERADDYDRSRDEGDDDE